MSDAVSDAPQILTSDPTPADPFEGDDAEPITLTRGELKAVRQRIWDKARTEFLGRRDRRDAKATALANKVAAMEQIVTMTVLAATPPAAPPPAPPAQPPTKPQPKPENVFAMSRAQLDAIGPQGVADLIRAAWCARK